MKDRSEILLQLENLYFIAEKIKGTSYTLWESLCKSDESGNDLRAYAAYTVFEMSDCLSSDFRTSLEEVLHIVGTEKARELPLLFCLLIYDLPDTLSGEPPVPPCFPHNSASL